MPAAPGRFQSRSQSQWISGMTLEIWKNRQDSAGHFSWAAGDVTGMPSKALSKLGGLFSWAVVRFTEIGEIVDFRPKIRWTKKLLQQSLCSLQDFISFLEQQHAVLSQFWLKTSCGSSRWSDGGFFGSAMAGAVGCSGNLLNRAQCIDICRTD